MPDKSEIESSEVIQNPGSDTNTPATLEDAVTVSAEEADDDLIVLSIKEDDLPDAVLKAVMVGLGEEQASLKTLRVRKSNENKDTSHISLKRGTLLKYMSETLLQRQALTGRSESFDLRGPKFREIFKMFLQIVSDTFDQVNIPAEYKEIFFSALGKNLEGWEEKAEKHIKKMEKTS